MSRLPEDWRRVLDEAWEAIAAWEQAAVEWKARAVKAQGEVVAEHARAERAEARVAEHARAERAEARVAELERQVAEPDHEFGSEFCLDFCGLSADALTHVARQEADRSAHLPGWMAKMADEFERRQCMDLACGLSWPHTQGACSGTFKPPCDSPCPHAECDDAGEASAQAEPKP